MISNWRLNWRQSAFSRLFFKSLKIIISIFSLTDNKQLPDSLDLFSVQLQTSEVRVDPQVVSQPEGIYTLRIGAFDLVQTPKQKIGILQSQVSFEGFFWVFRIEQNF